MDNPSDDVVSRFIFHVQILLHPTLFKKVHKEHQTFVTKLLLEFRRDRSKRKFNGISSQPSFKATIQFAFASNATASREIVKKKKRGRYY